MRKELGKWLMDIAKYIVTAVVISSMFGDMDSTTVYLAGTVAIVGTLSGGLLLISDKEIRPSRLMRIFRFRRRRNQQQTN